MTDLVKELADLSKALEKEYKRGYSQGKKETEKKANEAQVNKLVRTRLTKARNEYNEKLIALKSLISEFAYSMESYSNQLKAIDKDLEIFEDDYEDRW